MSDMGLKKAKRGCPNTPSSCTWFGAEATKKGFSRALSCQDADLGSADSMLIHIMINLPSRLKTKELKMTTPLRQTLEDLSASSQHVVIFTSTRIQCIVCLASLPLHGQTTRDKLGTSCVPECANHGRPITQLWGSARVCLA